MGLRDWIKEKKECAELKALSRKYSHDVIGTPGAGIRHYEKLAKLRNETGHAPENSKPKTKRRPSPSWER